MTSYKLFPARLIALTMSLAFFTLPMPALLAAAEKSATPAATSGPMPGRPHGSQNPHATLGPEKLITVALQHRAEGRYPEALEVLDQAISKYPDNADLFLVRGSLRLEQNQVSVALHDLNVAQKLEPDNPAILVNRAQALKTFGRGKEAMKDLDHAVNVNPDYLAARFNRGVMLYSDGKLKKALADFDHCIAIDPHSAAPYFNRASVYEAMGKNDQAIADFERFLELSDNKEWKKTAQQLLDKLEASNKKARQEQKSQKDSG